MLKISYKLLIVLILLLLFSQDKNSSIAQDIIMPVHIYSEKEKDNNFQKFNEKVNNFCKKLVTEKFPIDKNGKITYLTLIEALEIEKNSIDKKYNAFLQDKSNMENNYKLYKKLTNYAQQYKSVSDDYMNGLKRLFDKYDSPQFPIKSFDVYLIYIKTDLDYGTDFFKFLDQIDMHKKVFERYAQEIKDFSVNYEKNQLKYELDSRLCEYPLENGLVYNFARPDSNCIYPLYDVIPMIGLKVIQSTQDGVLVQKPFDPMLGNSKTIFIETDKQFADEETIQQQIYLVYTGYFQYQTVLGANKKVWKFKEVDLKLNKYYFIGY